MILVLTCPDHPNVDGDCDVCKSLRAIVDKGWTTVMAVEPTARVPKARAAWWRSE